LAGSRAALDVNTEMEAAADDGQYIMTEHARSAEHARVDSSAQTPRADMDMRTLVGILPAG
jgi:hypothetical protein